MPLHFFSAKRLAKKIARGEVSSREYALYLMSSFLLYTALYYSGLVSGNPMWSWMAFYEGAVVILITIVGVIKSYDASGGDENSHFVTEFSALYVPVSVTTVPLVWISYWAISIGLNEGIVALANSHLQIATSILAIGSNFFGVLLFLSAVLSQAIIFYRITKLFGMIQESRAAHAG